MRRDPATENGAGGVGAAIRRRPVKRVARQNQSGDRIRPVAVGDGGKHSRAGAEGVNDTVTGAIGVDRENQAPGRTASGVRVPIQSVAIKNQGAARISPAAVGDY